MHKNSKKCGFLPAHNPGYFCSITNQYVKVYSVAFFSVLLLFEIRITFVSSILTKYKVFYFRGGFSRKESGIESNF